MEYLVTRIDAEDELYHYGVKGMKWGHRKRIISNNPGSANLPLGAVVKGGPKTRPAKLPFGTVVKGGPRMNQMDNAKNAYKIKKKQIDSAYSKAGAKYESLTNGGTIRNKKAEADFERAADKWAVERKNARAEYRQQKRDIKKANKKPMSTKKKVAIGAAVVAGTALAAYGTYKASKYIQANRNTAAYKKAKSYLDDNFIEKYGTSTFKDGSIMSHYSTKTGSNRIDVMGRGNSVIGKHNAKVVSNARDMYKNATNTKLDRGLAKVVNAGDSVGRVTRNAGDSIAKTARKASENVGKATGNVGRKVGGAFKNAGNRVLDVVNPQYEYVPGAKNVTTSKYGDVTLTKTVQNMVKQKKRRI